MAAPQRGWTDEQIEQMLGNLLRVGVLASAALVLLGGILYLIQEGADISHHSTFDGEPPELRHPALIVREAFAGKSRGLIQLGLLLLIATPVARVAFTVLAFWRQRDYLYVAVTLIVLVLLLYSMFWGHLPEA